MSRSAWRAPHPHGERWADHESTRVVVHRSPDGGRARELALVLRATGIAHALRREEGGHLLVVPPAEALRATEELRRYAEENAALPDEAPPPLPARLARGRGATAVYALLLLVVDQLAGRRAFGLDWTVAGRIEARWVADGELWRGLTALTLHVDAPHLVGNLLFGAGFGLGVAQLLGGGVGWAAILLAGYSGNLLAAALEPERLTSVGASTAVFAAVGMLAALSFRLRHRQYRSRLRRWTPWVMALALLGFLGTAGERTNILSHATGFLAGCLWGVLLSPLVHRRPGMPTQLAAGLAALTLATLAWLAALA